MAMRGPLAPWEAGIAGQLTALGYAPSTAVHQMQLVGRLSRFLQQRGLGVGELNARVLERFFKDLHTYHGPSWPTAKSLRWLVEYLQSLGVTPAAPSPTPRSAQDELIDRYRVYLVQERGLVRKTVIARERTARLFLAVHIGRELRDLDASDVSRFVTSQCRRLTVRSAERLVNGMRSFLRYLLVEGLTTAPLASAVPSVGRWSGASAAATATSVPFVDGAGTSSRFPQPSPPASGRDIGRLPYRHEKNTTPAP